MTTEMLVLALFLPRLALFVMWVQHELPIFPLPNWAELLMSVIVPRLVIVIMIYYTLGVHGWFWVHLVVAILVYCAGGNHQSRRSRN
jgi:hypothetical protein